MDNPKDEGDLHLVSVEKADLVGSRLPDRINTEGIGGIGILAWVLGVEHHRGFQVDRARVAGGEGQVLGTPVGTEDVHGLAEDVVVDEAGVDREDAHQEDDVAASEEDVEDLGDVALGLQTLLCEDHPEGGGEHDHPVPGVPEHHGEEERKGGDSVD